MTTRFLLHVRAWPARSSRIPNRRCRLTVRLERMRKERRGWRRRRRVMGRWWWEGGNWKQQLRRGQLPQKAADLSHGMQAQGSSREAWGTPNHEAIMSPPAPTQVSGTWRGLAAAVSTSSDTRPCGQQEVDSPYSSPAHAAAPCDRPGTGCLPDLAAARAEEGGGWGTWDGERYKSFPVVASWGSKKDKRKVLDDVLSVLHGDSMM